MNTSTSRPTLARGRAPPRRDVSSVELLMNDHQGLKSEIEARGKSVAACLELGKTLILGKSPAADEVPGRGGMGVDPHWEPPPHLLDPPPDQSPPGEAAGQEEGAGGEVGQALGVAAAE